MWCTNIVNTIPTGASERRRPWTSVFSSSFTRVSLSGYPITITWKLTYTVVRLSFIYQLASSISVHSRSEGKLDSLSFINEYRAPNKHSFCKSMFYKFFSDVKLSANERDEKKKEKSYLSCVVDVIRSIIDDRNFTAKRSSNGEKPEEPFLQSTPARSLRHRVPTFRECTRTSTLLKLVEHFNLLRLGYRKRAILGETQ